MTKLAAILKEVNENTKIKSLNSTIEGYAQAVTILTELRKRLETLNEQDLSINFVNGWGIAELIFKDQGHPKENMVYANQLYIELKKANIPTMDTEWHSGDGNTITLQVNKIKVS